MSPIKTGFVGLSSKGWASLSLGPSLMKSPQYTLVAVSTTSVESAKTSAEAQSRVVGHAVKPYHGSTQAIANDSDIELVAVSVKAPLHKEVFSPSSKQEKTSSSNGLLVRVSKRPLSLLDWQRPRVSKQWLVCRVDILRL